MNNSVYGKTLENVRNHVDVKLVTSTEEAKTWICKPNFSRLTINNKHFAAIHMLKKKVVQDKPRYVGFTVLELSKLHMYNFHYNYIIPKYGDKAKLLFTDTDSLMYEIEIDDFYRDISPDVHERFDTSNYPKDHPSGIPTGVNKKIIRMFKDEASGLQVVEFVGLRAKLYAYLMDQGKKSKKCKGIKKYVVQNSITFNDFKDFLFNQQPQMRQMNVIRSHKHDAFSERVNKVALSNEDDKRIILEDGISTLAHRHYLSRN